MPERPGPDPVDPPEQPEPASAVAGKDPARSGRGRLLRAAIEPSRRQVVVALVLALVGFGVVVQVRTAGVDSGYDTLRQQDLIDVLNGLAGTSQRAQGEIVRLTRTRDELQNDNSARRAALAQARTEVDTLSVLAGLVPVTGPGRADHRDGGDRDGAAVLRARPRPGAAHGGGRGDPVQRGGPRRGADSLRGRRRWSARGWHARRVALRHRRDRRPGGAGRRRRVHPRTAGPDRGRRGQCRRRAARLASTSSRCASRTSRTSQHPALGSNLTPGSTTRPGHEYPRAEETA